MSESWVNRIHQGDAATVLRSIPESSVHMVITSPPYYFLRDYNVEGQIGREKSVQDYIDRIVEVGQQLREVLRDDGSWWVNLGDTYASSDTAVSPDESSPDSNPQIGDLSTPRKCKMMIPERVAMALINDGWILRNEIIWQKTGGGTPEPVKDRASKSHETIYHFVPKENYWYDRYAVNKDGVAPKDVWEIPAKPHPEAHFAVFPAELVEKPLKLTCPPKVCEDCGTPYTRVTEEKPLTEATPSRPQAKRAKQLAEEAGLTTEHLDACRAVGFSDAATGQACQTGSGKNTDTVEQLAAEAKEVLGGYFREFTSPEIVLGGWEQVCACNTDETQPGIALDPFIGSGTVAEKAKDLGRRFAGIELNPEYVALAQQNAGVTVENPKHLLSDNETTLSQFSG